MTRLGVAGALLGDEIIRGDVEIGPDGSLDRVGCVPIGSGLAAPGFIDLQVNGFAGVDYLTASKSEIAVSLQAMLASGVTAAAPTLTTAAPTVILEALERLAELPAKVGAMTILGVHLEGPFISDRRLGAHPREHRRDPSPELMAAFGDAAGIAIVTIAPELPGAMELIRQATAAGTVVAVGHSEAGASVTERAFDAGASLITHAFNAMSPIAGRSPGPLGAALSRPDVAMTVIADRVHIADQNLRWLIEGFGQRVVCVTDAVSAAGATEPTPSATLGGVSIESVRDAPRLADGTLAGSVLTLDVAVRNLVDLGLPVERALATVTRNPAAAVRRKDLGVLKPGCRGDIVILGDDLHIESVIVDGEPVWRR